MEDELYYTRQPNCKHAKQQLHKQRRIDFVNGFELTFTRCLNCHKIVGIEARKFSKH